MESDTEALFTRVGDGVVRATGYSRGPWSPDALHGGPVAALLAGEAEAALGPSTPVSRLTIDLERPVPLADLRVTSRIVRPGRKVQVAEVELHAIDGTRLARATALGVRRTEVLLPDGVLGPIGGVALDTDAAPSPVSWRPDDLHYFHLDAVEWGGQTWHGPVITAWMRLAVPVVLGREVSALQRAAAASDFMNGISSQLTFGEWVFINPDLTITLHRAAIGEWVGVRAVTRLDPLGVGTAEADLFDGEGRIGHAVQNLIVEPAGLRPTGTAAATACQRSESSTTASTAPP